MKKNERACFEALKKIGAPVFERSDRPDTFGLSGEGYFSSCPVPKENWDEDRIWCDYYSIVHRIPGYNNYVDVEVCKILEKFGLFFEWENAGCLFAFEA